VGNAIQQANGVPVQAMTIDDICSSAKIARIDFMKMNIEGAEKLAIAGMKRMIACTSVVCISCHDFRYVSTGNAFFKTKKAVESFLVDHGFIIKPRLSEQQEHADQVNAYNPRLADLNRLKL
jgi:hypothetical protein